MGADHSLILDIGTSGAKALLFTFDLEVVGRAYAPLSKDHPRRGWVEQNPDELVAGSKRGLCEVG